VLSGSKFFVTSGGEAALYLVLARSQSAAPGGGMSALLVEKDSPGLRFGRPEEKLGLTATSSRELFFHDCRVPGENLLDNEGEGGRVVHASVLNWGFFGAAAISVGLARAATDVALRHARERTIAGQPIGAHQAVQSLLSDMVVATDAAEALLERCARDSDGSPETTGLNAFKGKLFASETAIEVCNKALQVMGGHGYTRDYPVERLLRDSRGLTLHFKTSEWLRQDIARGLLGL